VSRAAVGVAGALGLTAVALGAFGAHGLRERLGPGMLEVYRTGALYHLVHAVVALAVALGAANLRRPGLILTFLTLGVVVFSGSLYALAVTGIVQLGAVTPIGGLCLLVAWGLIVAEAIAPRPRSSG
jgi:uncharacterized membrane protein YgdD (TMEM256/DUF423 family)